VLPDALDSLYGQLAFTVAPGRAAHGVIHIAFGSIRNIQEPQMVKTQG
jgi:hypothetical protein